MPSSLPRPAALLLLSALLLAGLLPLGGCASLPPGGEPPDDGGTSLPVPTDALITFLVTAPSSTPVNAVLDIKGNQPELGSWEEEGGLVLARGEDGTHTASARFARGTALELKVTRGTWSTVMKEADGKEAANVTHVVEDDATVHVTVAAWADLVSRRTSTRTGTFELLDVPAASGLAARKALVYLPPGYATDVERRYPVLYLHDGQNVFDYATSFAGEWRADETAEKLIGEGRVEPLILVGVYNTPARIDEYTPVEGTGSEAHLGGEADAYGELLVGTVKPLIDARYRTRPEAEATGLAGSSLGGLVSMYLGMKRPDVFGRLGVVSPSIWWADRHILTEVGALQEKLPLRIWLDMGTAESGDPTRDAFHVENARALRDALGSLGWTPDEEAPYETDLAYLEAQGARHNESAWAGRFPKVLEYLYPAPQ